MSALPTEPRTVAAVDERPATLGQGLALLRVGWIGMALLALALFAAGVPGRFAQVLDFAGGYGRPLRQLGLTPTLYAGYVTLLDLAIVVVHVGLATLLFWHRAADRVALLVALALVTVPLSVTQAVAQGGLLGPMIHAVALLSSVTLLYVFPDGRFVPRAMRWAVGLWAGLALVAVLAPASPLSLATWSVALRWLALFGIVGGGVWAQAHRYARVSSEAQRQRTRWAGLGLSAAALAPFGYFFPFVSLPSLSQASLPGLLYQLVGPSFFTLLFLYRLLGFTLVTALLLLFPISFAVAILRYRLWEIDLLLNRTLVYGGLTALVVGLYVLVVGTLGVFFRAGGNLVLAVLATGLVAVLAEPLRRRLQGGVNRLMYGERDDPVTVLARLGEQLERVATPAATLPAIVGTIAQALKLPYVAIVLPGEAGPAVIAAVGQPGPETKSFPLLYQGDVIGQLLVAPRAPGEAFSTADYRLLTNLARQAGTAVYAAQLTAKLQHSRERLVLTREAERRRVQRDLHDGLGPQLASLSLKLDAMRNLLHRDPARVEALLGECKAQTQGAIADIRRLVYDLHPPLLDQLGLVGALRQHVAAQAGAADLRLTVEASPELPPLPAAVEVAAYRIAVEALTNVVRHARARQGVVRLALAEGGLRVTVTDDGRGLPEDHQPGVGLRSLRERAAELGGTCEITSGPAGTRIEVWLPVSTDAAVG